MFLEYLLKSHFNDCLAILSEDDILGYYSVKIDFMKLFETYPDVGDKVLCNPIETLVKCDQDLIKAQQMLLEREEYKQQVSKIRFPNLKRNVHARFFGLPVCPELHRTVFPKNVDMLCFLKVSGTTVRVTQTKMLEYNRKYVCVKCKYENLVEAEFEHRYVLKAPSKCGNDEKRCKSTTFTQVNLVSREHCKDYQEIKIQEQVNKLSIGTIPGSMWVVLEDDLVDSCKPGDDVNICGTVRRRWRPSANNKKCEVELVLQANYIEVCNAQRSEVVSSAPDVKECFDEFWDKFEACPLKGRDRILASVCPQVYGLHLVKLALLLTVITGSNHVVERDAEKSTSDDSHTTRVRGQCHLLLVGDPGTGKSQLLRAGAELTPRSVFTSGAGSTRAGLTCSALREDGEWQLEAGALVLSDGGVCCIDEIGQLREHDRTSIHEAMEQQTISIAKAGIVCKLNTRCAVVAACNPKGHYLTDQPLSVNVSLGTPLLSRFDLIFILLDSKNKSWDKLVSSYILFGGSNKTQNKNQWSIEKLQTYIALVGPRTTRMTKSANIILQTYYMAQRKSAYRDPSRTTVRMLDSLVRLSQAHCRLMYRTTILATDAVIAISLVDLSMQDCTLSDTVDALHSTFPKYSDYSYLCLAKNLLTKLNLYEIWQEELLYYGKLLGVDHKTLESEIDHGNCSLFARFDDVTDDSIPLSSSIITSSYFRKDEVENMDEINEFDSKKSEVKEKLVATLKKHATLNMKEKSPPKLNTKAKRKRKEVSVEADILNGKKKTKKACNATVDDTEILRNVPSVNDVFSELGIDFNFGSTKENEDHSNEVLDEPVKVKIENESTVEDATYIDVRKDTSPQNPVSDKLKMFQYKENRDLSKFYDSDIPKSAQKLDEENTNMIVEQKDLKIYNNAVESKNNEIESDRNQSAPSSQISIFESSICDLDLENDNAKKSNIKVTKPTKIDLLKSTKPAASSSQISIFETSDCDIDLDF